MLIVSVDATGFPSSVAGAYVQERTAAAAYDAQAWLTGLVASHRYLEDIWASAT